MNNRKLYIAIQIGLVLSLVLNGFLAGVIVTGPFFHGPPNPSHRLYEAAKDLPPDVKAKVEAILDKRIGDVEAAMHHGKSGFDAIRSALMAPTLDPAKLDAAIAGLSSHHVRVGTAIGRMLKEVALAIPDPEMRKEFFRDALPPPPPHRF